jgi:hypothetical protein
MKPIPSPEEIRNASTSRGGPGYTRKTLAAWGISWPPQKGWKQRLKRQWREAEAKRKAEARAGKPTLLNTWGDDEKAH